MTTDGAAFRGTLGDAVTAAGGDAALIETAKSAYVTGVHAALGTAAVILAVMAVVATVVLPQKSMRLLRNSLASPNDLDPTPRA